MDTDYTPSTGLVSLELSTDEANLVLEALSYAHEEGYLMGNEDMAESVSERLEAELNQEDITALLDATEPLQAVVAKRSI